MTQDPETGIDETAALSALAARVRRDLLMIRQPEIDWMPQRRAADGRPILDVLIVGAGQGGIATAFQLIRERVTNIRVIDQAPAGLEGPWRTYARMRSLRSLKTTTGPDLDVPSLTYQAYHEARFGAESWAALDKISRELWADYLAWYRRLLELPVRNDTRLTRIEPQDDHLAAHVTADGRAEILLTRKLVLATGQDGTGRWWMPDAIEHLPEPVRCHAAQAIDFAALVGKRIAVIGANATAWDNAAVALERGARVVHLLCRRPELQRIQPYRWLSFAGFLRHLSDLDDEWRWRFMSHILGLREGVPGETYKRAMAQPNFTLHLGAPIDSAAMVGDSVRLETPAGTIECDFVICGTGMDCDLGLRPELAAFADKIAIWADRYDPPAAEAEPRLARYPYLGPDYAFLEKVPGSAPFLRDIHDFTFGATMSFGPSGASINAMKFAVPKLVAGLTRALFRADAAHHFAELQNYRVPQFLLPHEEG